MLSDDKITETESKYLAIDSGDMTAELVNEIRNYIYLNKFEQHCYLEWLLVRWTNIRKNKTQLPTRTTYASINETVILFGLKVPDKIKRYYSTFKSGDWICRICGDHQFSNNKVCRICKSSKPSPVGNNVI